METGEKGRLLGLRLWTGCALALLALLANLVSAQIRYSIPEEMPVGSFIGSISTDLGLEPKRLVSGKARVFTEDGSQYVGLDKEKGQLVVKEKMDREQLCGDMSACSVGFEVILDTPMELYRVTVDILDINDNRPVFPKSEINLEISELALAGARFSLASATDPDVGANSLQSYTLQPTDHFNLNVQNGADGSKNVEMVLQSALDREEKARHHLTLTAFDGGKPQRSAVVKINVVVLDANDNAPMFNQRLYKTSIVENAPQGTVITTVGASDADESTQAIRYYFDHAPESIEALFSIDEQTGEIKVVGGLDYEKHKQFKIQLQAKDHGGLTDTGEIMIDVVDVNDNAPKITLMSFSNIVSEDAEPGTVLAMINVQDLDSGDNSRVTCSIQPNTPFKIVESLSNYYNLVTDSALDREDVVDYNITITAVDSGRPALSSTLLLSVKLSDVNDHAPQFEQEVYDVHIAENNAAAMSVLSVKADDADWGRNSRVSYFLVDGELNGAPLASYISVNADSGVIYAVKSFDYEQLKSFKVQIKAQDGGSPPMSSNATLNIFIQDRNDNAPQVLYPVQTGGSVVAEIVPRSAEVGYLVTKVVAVDVDSGQNAWLSYKLQKATDRALFEVGAQNGEIRTVRQVTDKDAVKQKLTVVVEDNGQPSRSAVVNINVAVADTFPEALSEFTDFTHSKHHNDDLTFYLVLALAAVSFLFITTVVVIISVKIYRWRQSRTFYQSNLPVIPYYPPGYADTGVTATLPHVYHYDACTTTDSRKSECKYSTLGGQSVLVMDPSFTETMQRAMREKNLLDNADTAELQKPPNNDWRLPPNQRPGPSGAGVRPEEAGVGAVVGTGPWPNPPTEAEQLQALMAAANVSEATATLGPRYNAQYVADYRQNVYIPGSTATLTANPQQQMLQQALPPPQAPPQAAPAGDVPKAAPTPACKKKVTKKDKK